MATGQVFCRGSVALHHKKPVLVLRPLENGRVVVVRLIGDRPPFHRSDVNLGTSAFLLRNRVARACEISAVAIERLRPLRACPMRVPDELVQQIEAAEQAEARNRRGEEFGAGILPSNWRGPKLGDCGRKVGGAPSD